MKPMICKCCGGKIDKRRMICEYCGTKYESEFDNTIRIETYQNPCKVFGTTMEIPMDDIKYIGEQKMSEIAIRQLSRNLADAIAPMMDIRTEYEPMRRTQRITARIRVVEPEYLF